MTRTRTRTTTLLAASTLALAGVLAPAVPAGAAHSGATIHPGVQTYTEGAQCTANFVFTNGADTFIGQAAHCSGTGGSTETDGCLAGSLPLGTKVEVDGATQPGTMVYNSWLTMQQVGEKDANACAYNDFALIKLDPADAGRVSPSIPVLGGPTGVNTGGVGLGESVYSYGNSSLRAGISQLSPKEGISLGTTGGGWTHPVYTVTPGVPGDSGSAFVDAQGRALGVLSTLALAPLPASNNVSDLNKSLTYANTVGGMGVSLVQGGAFSGPGAVLRGLLG
ncbi:MAG: serine protease [Frankiales bacterium]|nr:serine protease [Frankiales bacterium]